MLEDRRTDVDRGDHAALVGGLRGKRVSAAVALPQRSLSTVTDGVRRSAPQQFVTGEIGCAVYDDEQLVGRASRGQRAQVVLAAHSLWQIRDHQAVSGAQLANAGEKRVRDPKESAGICPERLAARGQSTVAGLVTGLAISISTVPLLGNLE